MIRKFRNIAAFLTLSLFARVLALSTLAVGGFMISSDSLISNISSTKLPNSTSNSQPTNFEGLKSNGSNFLGSFGEAAMLAASDADVADQLGFSVAIDGDTSVVGAPGDDDNKGAAYVFVRNEDNWTFQQKLAASDGLADDHFGWAVAISGETIVVGSYDLNGQDQGAAYIFARSGLVWNQQQKLTSGSGNIDDQYGSAVAISDNTVIVGAFGDGNSRGTAYVYADSGAVWGLQQKLDGADTIAGDEFGWSVSLTGDLALVGSPRDDESRGAAYIFRRTGTMWEQEQKLTPTDGVSFGQFGHSVAVDGESALIGAVLDEVDGIATGSAYVFTKAGTTWSQQQKLKSIDGAANDKFGGSVALDGGIAIIGSNGSDPGVNIDQGAAYVFSRNVNMWSQQQKLTASDGSSGDNFGGSVGVSGKYLIAGSYLASPGSVIDAGTAHIFSGPGQVEVSGRILTATGAGLRNSRVTLTDSAAGTSSSVLTGSLGYYQFSNVATGRTYTITVASKRYRFSVRTIEVNGSIMDLDLVGQE